MPSLLISVYLIFQVLCTAYDDNLGGRNFDQLISEYFVDDFKKRFKIDAHTKPRAFIRLLNECEKLKKNMSATAADMTLSIECFMEDKDVSGKMNREILEEISVPLLHKVEAAFKSLLDTGRE